MPGFTSENMKGNKHAKKDFTKEMAKHVTSIELFHSAKMITELSDEEMTEKRENGDLSKESFLTYHLINNISTGQKSQQSLQWLVEMIVGKAKQQVEHSGSVGKEMDLSKLSKEELIALQTISQKATN